jgi:hypothetical protein
MTVSEDGSLRVRGISWVQAILDRKVVVVMSALARCGASGEILQVAPFRVLIELIREFGTKNVVLFAGDNRSGIQSEAGYLETIRVDLLHKNHKYKEMDVVRELVRGGADVTLTSVAGLGVGGVERGTRIVP